MENLTEGDTYARQQEVTCEEAMTEVVTSTEEVLIETEGHVLMAETAIRAVQEVDMEMEDAIQESVGVVLPVARETVSGGTTPTRSSPEIQITRMSFAWASQEQGMTRAADGLFYDQEGIKYHRTEIEGQYCFEQVTSVLEETSHRDSLHSTEDEATVGRNVDDAEFVIPPEIHALLTARPVDGDGGEEIGTQSSRIIAETPETPE